MSERNPLVDAAVEVVMRAVGATFDKLWSRDDAQETVEAFLDRRVSFLIGRDGLTILEHQPPA